MSPKNNHVARPSPKDAGYKKVSREQTSSIQDLPGLHENVTFFLSWKLPYLHLQLLDFRIVDEEGEGLLPHWSISLVSGLEKDTKERSQHRTKAQVSMMLILCLVDF